MLNHYNFGLGNKEEISSLYQASELGDNSFLKPNQFSEIIPTKIITLGKWVEKNSIKKIKLFKVEAEGFEPEVLEGAKDVLKIIEYNKLRVSNIDITIISQVIFVDGKREVLEESISKLLNIDVGKVNVKGKTTDNTGLIGDKKASACLVTLLIENA